MIPSNMKNSILLSGEPGVGKIVLLLKLIRSFNDVIWVTTVRSARMVRQITKRDDIWIIDAFSWISSHPKDVVIGDVHDLNKLSLNINSILDSVGNDECLLVFDSISGLLTYHPIQKVMQFLKSLLVRTEGKYGSVFTFIKNAHDRQTELTIYMLFPSVVELIRMYKDFEMRMFVRIVKSVGYINPNFAEFKIMKDDILLPKHVEEYIFKQLR
jgi:KaiC/GvpD/RAD55 family RecA-like ATPase